MFSKILIANRGEIAARIARTCQEMGIRTVAIFSEADRTALHVRACDEAYCVGPAPATESYLKGDHIIEIARKAGCEAIHPGYGFLSENAAFARAVTDAGLAWIGPPPEAIALMGSKIESKRLAQSLGVPTVPGYSGDDQAESRLVSEAEGIGFPVLIKASAGGGGKGMRVVTSAQEMPDAISGARREARAAFGDDTLLLEKYLQEPRHIEVQVLGDNYGRLVHLGERECSIQRRHQKVLEESPSPAVTPELRAAMTRSALALARAAGYANAGTVEFIYEDGNYYFLEMNTRLQVEHPVTEEAIDIDLVEAQIRIAAGDAMWLAQEDVQFNAHAIEARLYAEDPEHDFLPSTGEIKVFDVLDDARLDAGVAAGDSVTPYYDPMIAKVVAVGQDRQAAVDRMRSVLGSMLVAGPKTNLDFLRWLVAHPQFELGNLSTRFIERYYRPGAFPLVPYQATVAGTALIALYPEQLAASGAYRELNPWRASPWRQARRHMALETIIEGRTYRCELSGRVGKRDSWSIKVTQDEHIVYEGGARMTESRPDPTADPSDTAPALLLQFDDDPTVHSVRFDPVLGREAFAVYWEGREYWVRPAPALSTERLETTVHAASEDTLESPMPGKVLKVMVSEGDEVHDDQPLVIIEAMKMEFTVRAPHDGRVAHVHYEEGAQVAVGDVLIELDASSDHGSHDHEVP
ncbi:MAG: biotin carboxylase N-terminal domain-containing protein [Chloroflexia bacterium]